MRGRSILRRTVGVWLMVDGVTTGLWFGTLADSLGERDAGSAAVMVLRMLAAALSVVAGWLITQRRLPARPLGTCALILIAAFGLVGAWSNLLPSNLDPSFRWPMAWVQVAAAAVAIAVLRSDDD